MPTFVADRAERLDVSLARLLPLHTRSRLARAIADGLVRVRSEEGDDLGEKTKAGLTLKPGWTVEIGAIEERAAHDLAPADIALDVLYESEACLVVNKPRGLATHPAMSLNEPSLVNALLGRGGSLSTEGGEFRPGIVHRLDKETTGLLVVAKTDAAHADLARQIETREAGRRYLAIVGGVVAEPRFTVDAPLSRHPSKREIMAVSARGKAAITRFKRIERLDRGTLLGAKLETGRTHQIRAHLASVGLPVLGDSLYAPGGLAQGPMLLHAAFLAFVDPGSHGKVALFAPPPEEFGVAVERSALDPF